VTKKRAFIVTGVGYGDEGKGTTAHWVGSEVGAHTVVRTGGPQAFHRVARKNGGWFVHSQFGSGTLDGRATHLSQNMVIDPHGIFTEGNALVYEMGMRGVFEMMTIHEDALVITPFHAIANRLRELARGDGRYGSVGIGVGETVLHAELFSDEAIRAKDLGSPKLREKLEAIRIRITDELKEIIDAIPNLPEGLREKANFELGVLKTPETVQWGVERFAELANKVRIVSTDFVAREILGRDGSVVLEGSQGVLLDRFYGFHPYTTKVRTTPQGALSLLREYGYDGEVKSLGVLRTYQTRHGGGPFVTESPALTRELPDAMNGNHTWQGKFRVGFLDFVALRYALSVCEKIDGLVVTCFDRIRPLGGSWNVCGAYQSTRLDPTGNFFARDKAGRIKDIKVGDAPNRLERQEKLGQLLRDCLPLVTGYRIPARMKQPDMIRFCSGVIKSELNCPVIAVSVGETEADKIELGKL
jgi:adenylosuccinate synthase